MSKIRLLTIRLNTWSYYFRLIIIVFLTFFLFRKIIVILQYNTSVAFIIFFLSYNFIYLISFNLTISLTIINDGILSLQFLAWISWVM